MLPESRISVKFCGGKIIQGSETGQNSKQNIETQGLRLQQEPREASQEVGHWESNKDTLNTNYQRKEQKTLDQQTSNFSTPHGNFSMGRNF